MTVKSNPEGKAWLAILSRISQWTETEISLPNQKYLPMSGDPFIIVQPVGLSFENEVISFDCGDEHRSMVNFSVMTPLTWDYAASVGMCGRLCDWFPNGARYVYDDVRVQVLNRPRVVFSPRIDGGHNRTEVQANFRFWG